MNIEFPIPESVDCNGMIWYIDRIAKKRWQVSSAYDVWCNGKNGFVIYSVYETKRQAEQALRRLFREVCIYNKEFSIKPKKK